MSMHKFAIFSLPVFSLSVNMSSSTCNQPVTVRRTPISKTTTRMADGLSMIVYQTESHRDDADCK